MDFRTGWLGRQAKPHWGAGEINIPSPWLLYLLYAIKVKWAKTVTVVTSRG